MICRRLLSRLAPVFFLLINLIAPPLLAQEAEDLPAGPEGGAKLAEKLRGSPPEATRQNGVFKILHRAQKLPPISVSCQTIPGSSNWSVVYETTATNGVPAERLTVLHAPGAANQYFYARAASPEAPPGQPKQLAGPEADIPFAGTDFWLTDLGFEFYDWPAQNLLKGEMRSGKPCYVLECVNPHPQPGGYSRVKLWIEKEHLAPLIAKAYQLDNTNRILKEYDLGSLKENKDTGNYEVKDLQIDNNLTGSTTKLEFNFETR
jgi:hypothetical protein